MAMQNTVGCVDVVEATMQEAEVRFNAKEFDDILRKLRMDVGNQIAGIEHATHLQRDFNFWMDKLEAAAKR